MKFPTVAAALAAALTTPGNAALPPGEVPEFLDRHCLECHDTATAKGDVDLEPLYGAPVTGENARLWSEVLDQLNLGEMPPKKKPRPATDELLAVTAGITSALETHAASAPRSSTALRRLNKSEYRNSVRDLLGIDYEPGERFPADGTSHGFDNNADALKLSSTLFERYLEAAEEVATAAIATAPQPERTATTADAEAIDCELGIRRDRGFEIASDRQNRARVFPVNPVTTTGTYRVSALVDPVRSGGKELRVSFKTGLPDRHMTVPLKNVAEFALATPERLEATIEIRAGETLHVSFMDGAGIPTISEQKKYQGPAVFIRDIAIDGPIIEQWPPAAHRKIFAAAGGKWDLKGAKMILASFARRAYRRPPTPEQLSPLEATFREERAAGANFREAIRAAITLAICSPDFLYIAPPTAPDERALDPFALAARLSYFLWSSTPDDALLAAAENGALASPGGLRTQAERLLDDPRAAAFTENFVGQWLRTREVGSMQPDPRMFPDYDGALEAAMRRETEMFIAHLIAEDLPIANVLDSDFTFLNARLARHYGIPGVGGETLQKVALPSVS